MAYPRWLPYPSSVLRAFFSFCAVSPALAVTRNVYGITPHYSLLWPVIVFSPVVITAFTHHIFFGEENTGYWPRLASWWEGVLTLMIPPTAVFLILILAGPFDPYLSIIERYTDSEPELTALEFALSMAVLVTASLFYKLDHLIRDVRPLRLFGWRDRNAIVIKKKT